MSDPVILVFQWDTSVLDFRRHVAKETSESQQGLCHSQQLLVGLVYSEDL